MHELNPEANDCQAESDDPRYGSVCNQCCGTTHCTGGPVDGDQDTPFAFDENSSNSEWAQKLVNVFHNN